MLTNFEQSFLKLIENEGGYANLKGDSGGETYKGISRANFPNWEGWHYIDTAKETYKITKDINSYLNRLGGLSNSVKQFYYKEFWQKVRANSLPTPLDFLIFDFAVNAGVRAAVKILQRSLMIQDDGIIGNQTKDKIAGIADVSSIVQALKVNIKKYYESLNQPRFIKGWLARVENNFKGSA